MSPEKEPVEPEGLTPENSERFEVMAIVGVGLIGGSLSLALKRAGFDGRVIGVSRAETVSEALDLGIIDESAGYDELADVAARSDLIVLASPIRRILEHLDVLGAAGSRLRPGTVVTDVGSTKREILGRAERALPDGVWFVGGHPMAGSERSGVAAADPFLFQNAYYVLTPGRDVPEAVVARLERFLGDTGARILKLDPGEHDRTAALISHLPQLLAVALVNFVDGQAESNDTALRLAAGGFRDMTRIASSPYGMWDDIFSTNSDAVREAMSAFARRIESTAAHLGEPRLEELFDSAAVTRARIPKDSKGFLRPLWEVLVVVEDRCGIISGIAVTLAEAEINIKDIEVVKVREDEGGTLRLAFSTREVAENAIRLLTRKGFQARLRE